MSATFCPGCGARIPDEAQFCARSTAASPDLYVRFLAVQVL